MKNLTKAWLAVMADCPYVVKQRIAALGYSAAMEADMLRIVRPALIKHGVALFITDAEVLYRERYTNAKGTSMTSTVMRVRGKLVHAESGESESICAIGEGADSSDKGCPKAHTIALKYLIRENLLIETGDDPDMERPVMDAAPPPPAPPPVPTDGNAATAVRTTAAEMDRLDGTADPTAAAYFGAEILSNGVIAYLGFSQPGKEQNWAEMELALVRSKAPAAISILDLTPQERVEVAKMIHSAAVKKGAPADLLDRLAECMAQLDDLANGGGK